MTVLNFVVHQMIKLHTAWLNFSETPPSQQTNTDVETASGILWDTILCMHIL